MFALDCSCWNQYCGRGTYCHSHPFLYPDSSAHICSPAISNHCYQDPARNCSLHWKPTSQRPPTTHTWPLLASPNGVVLVQHHWSAAVSCGVSAGGICKVLSKSSDSGHPTTNYRNTNYHNTNYRNNYRAWLQRQSVCWNCHTISRVYSAVDIPTFHCYFLQITFKAEDHVSGGEDGSRKGT